MHLRRALLLFAIVLGLAAVAATVSRPRDEPAQRFAAQPPAAEPDRVSEPPIELFFGGSRRTQALTAGQAATVLVVVDEPGQVEIARMGLSAAAEPLTAARFDVLSSRPGRYPIYFTPSAGEQRTRTGTLVVSAAGR